MKNNTIYILLIIALCLVIGCKRGDNDSNPPPKVEDGKLTSEKAQITIHRWMSDGQVTVRGIRESGKDNTARADVTFSNFPYTIKGGGGGTYSGPGIAVFKHYNDGRWVLTYVAFSQGFNSVRWDNLSVEVY